MASNYFEEYTATDDDEYFIGYDPTAVDPGQWLTIVTVSYIGLVALLLGPAVYLGRRWKKYFKAQRKLREEEAASSGKKEEYNDSVEDKVNSSGNIVASEEDAVLTKLDGEGAILRGLDTLKEVTRVRSLSSRGSSPSKSNLSSRGSSPSKSNLSSRDSSPSKSPAASASRHDDHQILNIFAPEGEEQEAQQALTVIVEDEFGEEQVVELPSTSAFRVPTFAKSIKRMTGIKVSLAKKMAKRKQSRKKSRQANTNVSPRLWKSEVDVTSGNTFWRNDLTGEVSWDKPPEDLRYDANRVILRSSSTVSSSSVATNTIWKPRTDPTSGRPYWYNKQTKERDLAYPPDLLDTGDDAGGSDGLQGCGALSCGAMDAAILLDKTDSNDSDSDSDDSDSSDDDSTFEDYDFDELPPRVVEAATILGYTKDKWDNSIPPPTEDLDWEELTKEQQAAAIVLGYTEEKWDGDSDSDEDGNVEGKKKKGENDEHAHKLSASYDDGFLYDDYDWIDLPSHAKDAARVLGYDRRAWDFGNGSTPIENKSWKRLTDEQKAAAKVLGYTSTFWNHEPKEFNQKEHVIRGWETFYSVFSFNSESKRILRLAIPFTAEAIIESVLEAVVAAFISKYLGSVVFTAYAMVDVFFSLTGSFSDAMDEASEALIAQALGMANFFLAGQYAQMTLFIWLIIEVPIYIVWIFLADDAILALGLGQEIADIAKAYVPIAALARFLDGFTSLADGLLRCDGKANAVVIVDTIFHILHVTAVGVAVINFNVGLFGVAWIEVITVAAYGIFMILLIRWKGWIDPYKKGLFRNFSLKNLFLVKTVLKMSLPLTVGYFLSYGEWEVLTFFAAYMGAAEVAAWCIAGAIWEVMEHAPSGISSAAVIRIGIHVGKGNAAMAKLSSYKSLLYSGLWSLIITGLFAGFSNSIIAFFTSDPVLIDMLKDLIVLIASGNVLMVLGSDAWHILTAQSRGMLATMAFFVCMWCVTMPLSAYFVFAKHYNLQAIAASVVIGYASIAFVLLYLVFTSNWPKVCMRVISKANRSIMNKPTKKKETVVDKYTIMTDTTTNSSSSSSSRLIAEGDIKASSQVTALTEHPKENATFNRPIASIPYRNVDLEGGEGIEMELTECIQLKEDATRTPLGRYVDLDTTLEDDGGKDVAELTEYKRMETTEDEQQTKKGRRAPFFGKLGKMKHNKTLRSKMEEGEAQADYMEFTACNGHMA